MFKRFSVHLENRDYAENKNCGIRGVSDGTNINNSGLVNSNWRDNKACNSNNVNKAREKSGEVATIFSKNLEEILDEPKSEIKPMLSLTHKTVKISRITAKYTLIRALGNKEAKKGTGFS